MQKGTDGFENVTAINTRIMNQLTERGGFIFGRDSAGVSAEAIQRWNTLVYSPNVAATILYDTRPLSHLTFDTISQRQANELRIKLDAIIHREASTPFEEHDDTLDMLVRIMDEVSETTIEHDALFNVSMLYRASRRTKTPDPIDPIIIAERIIQQWEESASDA